MPLLVAVTGTLPALTGTFGLGCDCDCGAVPAPPDPDPPDPPPDAAQASPGMARTAPAANNGAR